MRSWPESSRLATAAAVAGVAALGVVAGSEGVAWAGSRSWVPALLAGATLAALGIAALRRSRSAGALLLVSGIAWFVGDFHSSGLDWPSWVALHLSWVFLAPLVQLALGYPSGRPRTAV